MVHGNPTVCSKDIKQKRRQQNGNEEIDSDIEMLNDSVEEPSCNNSDSDNDNEDIFKQPNQFSKGDRLEKSDTEDELVDDEQDALENPTTEAPDDCVIYPNEYIKIRKWWGVEDDVRNSKDKNILRGSVYKIMEYLQSSKKVIGVEEVSAKGSDKHIRLFIDLDHVNYFTDVVLMKLILEPFIKAFAEMFLSALGEKYDKFDIKIYNTLTVEEICDGAAIAYKDVGRGCETGIHIYFTNIITHLASYKYVGNIIKSIKSEVKLNRVKYKSNDYNYFKNIDDGLYKDKPDLRTLH
jgi:hypothetical protein